MATTKVRIGTTEQKALLLKRLRDWHGGKLDFKRVCLIFGLPKPGTARGKKAGWLQCHEEMERWLNEQPEFEVRHRTADLGFGGQKLIDVCLVEAD
ncbi:MAG: hypothetical protein AAFN18_22725 [Cyanobacteria bacterium J06554_6]